MTIIAITIGLVMCNKQPPPMYVMQTQHNDQKKLKELKEDKSLLSQASSWAESYFKSYFK